MGGDQLTIVLLGAFWAGTSAVYTAIKNTNEVRDKILAGKVNELVLEISERRHLLFFDWLPLKSSIAAVSVVLGVIIVQLPHLANQASIEQGFSNVCYIASAVPFAGGLATVISGFADYRLMQKHIKR